MAFQCYVSSLPFKDLLLRRGAVSVPFRLLGLFPGGRISICRVYPLGYRRARPVRFSRPSGVLFRLWERWGFPHFLQFPRRVLRGSGYALTRYSCFLFYRP